MTGVIVSIEGNKQKGLIEADDGTIVKVHRRDMPGNGFRRGIRVEFHIEARIPRAIDVKVIS